jgi:DNA-binding NarL/FixJ family response regulator
VAVSLIVAARSTLRNELLSCAFNRRRKQFKVVACVLTGKDLLKQVAAHQPDVAVVRAALEDGPTAGFQVLQEVRLRGEREPARIVSATGTPLLTEREEQIARMVSEGLPNNEICTRLGLSAYTVKNHSLRIPEKLGVSNRVALVLHAMTERDGPSGSTAVLAEFRPLKLYNVS